MASRKEYELLMKLTASLDPSVVSSFRAAQAEIKKNQAAIKATSKALMKTVGVGAAAAAGMWKGFISPAADFEEQMSVVKAISGASSEDMVKLAEKAKEMGETTKFTAVESGQALEYMAMAGWKTEEMMDALPGVMYLAAASGEDLGMVSDIVTDAMTAFGMEAGEATRFADVLAATATNANTNVGLMGETFKYIAPLAGAMGYSIEDMSVAIGLMANAGVKGSMSGTALKTGLANLVKPTEAMQAVMDQYGVSLAANADSVAKYEEKLLAQALAEKQAINPKLKLSKAEKKAIHIQALSEAQNLSFEDTVIHLREKLGGLGEAEKAAAVAAIFGKEAMSGWLAIINSSEKDFQKVTEAVNGCTGASKKMADTRLDNLNGDITLAKSAWDTLRISIGELFLPKLREVTQGLTEIIKKLNTFVNENKDIVVTVAKVAGGLFALRAGSLAAKLGFLEMKGGVLSVARTFLGFKINLAGLAAAAAAGGGKITAIGKSLTGYFGGIKNAIGGVGGSIDNLVGGRLSGVFSKIGGSIQSGILTPLSQIGGKVTSALGGVGSRITGFFGGIGQKIAAGPLGKIGSVIQSIGSAAGAVLGGPLKGLGSLFGGIFSKAMPLIMIISALSLLFMKLSGEDISGFIEPIKQAFEDVKPVLAAVMEQFKELGKELLPVLMETVKQLAPLFGEIIKEILPIVLELIREIVPLLTQVIGDVLPVILNIIGQLAPLLTEIITAILPVILQLVKALLPVITQLVKDVLPIITRVLEAVMPILTKLIDAVLPVLMSLIEALMPVIEVLASIFSEVLGAQIKSVTDIIDGVMKTLGGLIDFVTGVFTGDWEKAWGGVRDIFGGIFDTLGALLKAPMNVIISIINGAIKGINSLGFTVPDWVPVIGGKGFRIDIPEIPLLEKGSSRTPDTFIAGDVDGKGGELVTNARGYQVFTAAQTNEILDNVNRVMAINNAMPPTVSNSDTIGGFIGALKNVAANWAEGEAQQPLPASTNIRGGGQSFTIEYRPTIYINGEKPGDLEERLKENNETLLLMFKDFLRKQREDEGRMAYV